MYPLAPWPCEPWSAPGLVLVCEGTFTTPPRLFTMTDHITALSLSLSLSLFFSLSLSLSFSHSLSLSFSFSLPLSPLSPLTCSVSWSSDAASQPPPLSPPLSWYQEVRVLMLLALQSQHQYYKKTRDFSLVVKATLPQLSFPPSQSRPHRSLHSRYSSVSELLLSLE